ncbi:MAG: hypothetical protein M1823_002796 [Watsoniomyces obsoletus]|nr:MAG: hypothetical protein M1823_002796 [Watsoniomyces obsoletus]
MASHGWRARLSCLAVLMALARADFPYNPARVLRADNADNPLAYIFLPSTTSTSSFRLLAVNTSTTLDAGNLAYTTLSTSLPFLEANNQQIAFTPAIDDRGNVSVYTGTCASKSTSSTIWHLSTKMDQGLKGQWSKTSISTANTITEKIWSGANFLASAISFSTQVDDDDARSKVYIFGGMCPNEMTSTGESWVSSANYSNSMLSLTPIEPSGTSSSSPMGAYELGITKSRGPPVAEAGYSLTALQPSYINISDTEATRQQNYILLGGHTREAFINMSQLALFSLPEETWSFPAIEPPAESTPTELALRQDSLFIDSRSGHTAVLTEDGKRVVVLGGWVGDISTPAIPQLLILELGEGYGGTGKWRWTIPSVSGRGIDDDTGIYGHGAAMLPGDVVMVIGGYTIPALSKRKRQRSQPNLNTKTYFLNVTSNSWINRYTKPAGYRMGSTRAEAAGRLSGLSSSSKKAAIGSGIAVGLCAILGAILVWIWYARRLRNRRMIREKELRQLSLVAQRLNPFESDSERYDAVDSEKAGGGYGPIPAGGQYSSHDTNNGNPYPWMAETRTVENGPYPPLRPIRGTEAERTGLLVEIPSPTRGLRRSLHSRGNRNGERLMTYHLAGAGSDEQRRRSFTGDIHPIDERDEFEEPPTAVEEGSVVGGGGESDLVSLMPTPDPFRDPGPLGGHADVSPVTTPAQERELEIQEWVSDWAAADAHLHGTGMGTGMGTGSSTTGRLSPDRNSPDKDNRTSSNLSERSLRSTVSASTQSHHLSIGNPLRTMSQRSSSNVGRTTSTVLRSSSVSSSGPNSGGSPTRSTPSPTSKRSQSLRLFTRPGSGDEASVTTRPLSTDFTQLQMEGEALLPRPSTGGSMAGGDAGGGMFNKGKSRAVGWLGSMRRALPFTGGGSNITSVDKQHGETPTSSSSPTKTTHNGDGNIPRRAASAGAAYWRTKQGAKDWDLDRKGDDGSNNRSRNESPGSRELRDDDEDWDVEAAVERRVVQVMFTVPKEKLRVVNAGEEMSLLSTNEGDEEDVRTVVGEGDGGAASISGEQEQKAGDAGKGKGKARADDGPSGGASA